MPEWGGGQRLSKSCREGGQLYCELLGGRGGLDDTPLLAVWVTAQEVWAVSRSRSEPQAWSRGKMSNCLRDSSALQTPSVLPKSLPPRKGQGHHTDVPWCLDSSNYHRAHV